MTVSAVGFFQVLPSLAYVVNHYQHFMYSRNHSEEVAGGPYQMKILERGTTDAVGMQLVWASVRSGCLSIPCRYIHPLEMVDEGGVEGAVSVGEVLERHDILASPEKRAVPAGVGGGCVWLKEQQCISQADLW